MMTLQTESCIYFKTKKNNPARNFLKVRYTFKFYSGMEGRIGVKKYLFLLLKGLGGSLGYLIVLIANKLFNCKNFGSNKKLQKRFMFFLYF